MRACCWQRRGSQGEVEGEGQRGRGRISFLAVSKVRAPASLAGRALDREEGRGVAVGGAGSSSQGRVRALIAGEGFVKCVMGRGWTLKKMCLMPSLACKQNGQGVALAELGEELAICLLLVAVERALVRILK